MAGDWIKMRCDLACDPAVIGIAAMTDLDEHTVVGKLHCLWSWANQQSQDGTVPNVNTAWIDRYLRHDGFADAMVSVGWLHVRTNGITIPNFDRHNGESAKQRALGTERKRLSRKKKQQPDSVTKVSRNKRDKSVTREEKRREENTGEVSPNPSCRTEPAGKESSKKSNSLRPRNDLFDAIVQVTGADARVNGSQIGSACATLLKAEPPYSPAEVLSLPAALAAAGFEFTITVGSVVKYIYLVRNPKEKKHGTSGDLGRHSRIDAPKGKYDDRGTVIKIGSASTSKGAEASMADKAGERSAENSREHAG